MLTLRLRQLCGEDWAAQARVRLQVRFVCYVYNFNTAITTTTGGAEHYGLRPLLVDTYRVYVYGVFVIVIGRRNRNRNCIL